MEVQDRIKIAAAFAFLVLGIVGYYLLGSASGALGVLSVVAGVLLAGAVALMSSPGKGFVEFAKEAVAEVKKVVWPTRKETIQLTMLVFGFVVALAIFMWIVDGALAWLFYDLFLGRGK
ncbi:preprotein translocase subunit SecE [Chitinivorax tropicus]|uniref:Protein translocase subunit SecE n=1 Tax=Chitinivorax tropicus TaxID=714531 RepID=A0A840MTC9_9PROT|nr:preprotein translocase subunit SecE [Chitinivorax tropicus]MBB5020477.1 preprotein translocase subunit SecE [Chitinivorax tropicus]